MSTFIVEGGHSLHGSISPQGAKNEALEVICATLLTPEKVTISNIPDIADIRNLIILLKEMGVDVDQPDKNTAIFQAKNLNTDYLKSESYRKKAQSLRGSVMVIGPLLARFGEAILPKPAATKSEEDDLTLIFSGSVNWVPIVNIIQMTHAIISKLQRKDLKETICFLTRLRSLGQPMS